MNGGIGRSQPPTPPVDQTEPTRPPCATNFRLALESDQEPAQRKHLAIATSYAVGVKAVSDCSRCIEGGSKMRCPLKFREELPPAEQSLSILETTQAMITPAILEVFRLPEFELQRQRLARKLSKGGPYVKEADDSLRDLLDDILFPQPYAKKDTAEETKSTEDKSSTATITDNDTVPDPRPAEGKEKDTLKTAREPRPRCARTFSSYLVERYEAQARWRKRNSGLPEEEITEFKHQPTLKLYASATIASEEATKSDCAKCLGGLCPLRTNADGAEVYRLSSTPVELGGMKIKTRRRIINRLDGLPIEKMAGPPDPELVRDLIESQFAELKPHPEQ